MNESNNKIVNMLAKQISTMFNPLIQNTSQSYQLLANQMGRITNFSEPLRPKHNQFLKLFHPGHLGY